MSAHWSKGKKKAYTNPMEPNKINVFQYLTTVNLLHHYLFAVTRKTSATEKLHFLETYSPTHNSNIFVVFISVTF